MIDVIIIGAGFAGSVIARYLAEEKNKKVMLVERRAHIAGNMYDYKEENGIIVQKYGPHIFHTNKDHVYNYITRFGEWKEFFLECKVFMNNKFTPSPFNFQTIDDYYSSNDAEQLKLRLQNQFHGREKATVIELLESKDELIREFAMFLFDNDYSLYTAKQWGVSPKEIDISILNRVPILFGYKTGYFDDKYQCMPKGGFTKVFEELLSHKNIDVHLNKDIKDILSFNYEKNQIINNDQVINIPVVYTGALDELFDMKFGLLPYRSLNFEFKNIKMKSFQDAPVVAYPQVDKYTRITEYSKLPLQECNSTTVAYEYPLQYEPGMGTEPYYPIINDKNSMQYEKYKLLASKFPNLYICGRLAEYKYYNMDQVIEQALMLARRIFI